jgi:ssDNA-binding Zn-finger/Zn-ribbon topoisomerase 1
MINVDLKLNNKGHEVVKKECPNCKASLYFVFQDGDAGGKYRSVAGHAHIDGGLSFKEGELTGIVKCTVCYSTYAFTIKENRTKVETGSTRKKA